MKVLVVTPSYFPIIGGSETLIRTLVTKLNESGVHTDIMAFNMNKKWRPVWRKNVENGGNFNVFKVAAFNPLPFFPVNPLYNPLRMNVIPSLSFKKQFKEYDIIHFLGEADLSMPLLSLSVEKPKIMHCVGVPGLKKQFQKHKIMKKLFVRLFQRLADIYAVFSSDEEEVLINMGISSNRIINLRYGIDTDFFKPDEKKRLSDLILFVGRIDSVKGLHVFLKSLSYVKMKTKVVIIGPTAEDRYFDQINEMSREINEQGVHTVEYLGSKDQDDLVPWYQKATVLVRPDLVGASGEGCSTMEALACGTPVIGVQNHVLKNGVNGLIVTPDSPEKLAEAINKILADEKLRERYGTAARMMMEEQFSVKSAVARLVRVYEDMLKQWNSSTVTRFG